MLNLMALDLSLRSSGWATVVETIDGSHQLRHGLIDTTKVAGRTLRGPQRLEHIVATVLDLVRRHECRAVVLENYAFARPNQAHQIGELGGAIRLHLHMARIPYVEIAPKTLKLWACANGNANKDQMLQAARDLADYDLAPAQDWHRRARCRCAGKSYDVADALLLHALAADARGLAWHHPEQAPWRNTDKANSALTDDLQRRLRALYPVVPLLPREGVLT